MAVILLPPDISGQFSNWKNSELEKCFWFLQKFEAYVNEGDISYSKQLPRINIKCTVLAQMYQH